MEEVKVNSRGITNRFSSYDSFLKVVAMQEIIYQANTRPNYCLKFLREGCRLNMIKIVILSSGKKCTNATYNSD